MRPDLVPLRTQGDVRQLVLRPQVVQRTGDVRGVVVPSQRVLLVRASHPPRSKEEIRTLNQSTD